MYSGTNAREGIDLDMLHKKDHGQIRYSRICTKDGEEVPWDDIVKGYKLSDDEYVVLTQKDLDSLDAEKSQTVDIIQFVDEADIDIRYFEKPYYLEVEKGGDKAYALLRESLRKSGKLALVKFVMHQRAHVAVIKPLGRALVLEQMRYPSDLREPAELTFPSDKDLTERELEMALKLVKQETKPFVSEDLRDTYTEELEGMIKAKTKGKKPVKPKKSEPAATTKDLMAALKASIKE
jgi:DNA end-binding protein Ku